MVNTFNTITGTGFDLHTYQPVTGFILGGHFIDCDYSINAHSDGDVLLHSIADIRASYNLSILQTWGVWTIKKSSLLTVISLFSEICLIDSLIGV